MREKNIDTVWTGGATSHSQYICTTFSYADFRIGVNRQHLSNGYSSTRLIDIGPCVLFNFILLLGHRFPKHYTHTYTTSFLPSRTPCKKVSNSAKLSDLLSGMTSRSRAAAANLGALPVFLSGNALHNGYIAEICIFLWSITECKPSFRIEGQQGWGDIGDGIADIIYHPSITVWDCPLPWVRAWTRRASETPSAGRAEWERKPHLLPLRCRMFDTGHVDNDATYQVRGSCTPSQVLVSACTQWSLWLCVLWSDVTSAFSSNHLIRNSKLRLWSILAIRTAALPVCPCKRKIKWSTGVSGTISLTHEDHESSYVDAIQTW